MKTCLQNMFGFFLAMSLLTLHVSAQTASQTCESSQSQRSVLVLGQKKYHNPKNGKDEIMDSAFVWIEELSNYFLFTDLKLDQKSNEIKAQRLIYGQSVRVKYSTAKRQLSTTVAGHSSIEYKNLNCQPVKGE